MGLTEKDGTDPSLPPTSDFVNPAMGEWQPDLTVYPTMLGHAVKEALAEAPKVEPPPEVAPQSTPTPDMKKKPARSGRQSTPR